MSERWQDVPDPFGGIGGYDGEPAPGPIPMSERRHPDDRAQDLHDARMARHQRNREAWDAMLAALKDAVLALGTVGEVSEGVFQRMKDAITKADGWDNPDSA